MLNVQLNAGHASNKFKKILVTGALGSGGSYLLKSLADWFPGSELFGLARQHSLPISINPKVKIFSCDLRDFSNTLRVIEEVEPDLIFNMASQANVLESFKNATSYISNNGELIMNLLEIIRRFPKTRFIHCSTSEVYGQVTEEEIPIIESQKFRPSSPYSISKIIQDLACDVYSNSYGLDIIRTRMFSYINPLRSDLFATSFSKQIAEIEFGKRDKLYHGNLESLRTLLDIRDAMSAYCLASIYCESGEAYNIGGNEVLKVGDVLQILLSYSTVKINCIEDKNLLRPVDVTLQIPNDTKFREKTGWKPKFEISETLLELLNFWRQKISQQT